MLPTPEDRRRAVILDAMGILLLSSRRDLPGAAPSRRVTLAPRQPQAPAAEPEPAAIAAAGAATAAAAPAAVRSPASRTPVVESLHLATLLIGDWLWIEDLGELPLAREQVALVRAMALACGLPAAAPAVRPFRWPAHDNPQLDRGPAAAASALRAFLRRVCEEEAVSRLCLLGTAAAERIAGLSLPLSAHMLPSTREMLAAPQRKRDAWATLRPLAVP
jgi:hypothetical protein